MNSSRRGSILDFSAFYLSWNIVQSSVYTSVESREGLTERRAALVQKPMFYHYKIKKFVKANILIFPKEAAAVMCLLHVEDALIYLKEQAILQLIL